jgi:hypothetical protein
MQPILQTLKFKIAKLLRPYGIFCSHRITFPPLLPPASQPNLPILKMDATGFSGTLEKGTKLQTVTTPRKKNYKQNCRTQNSDLNGTVSLRAVSLIFGNFCRICEFKILTPLS